MCGLSCCFGSEGGGRIVFPSQFFFPLNMFQQLANSYLLIRTDVFSHSWVVLPTKFLSVQAFRVFFFFVVHLLFLIVRFRLRFSHSRQMYLNGRKLNCFAKKNDAVCSLRFLSDESAGMYLVSRPRLSDKRTAHRTQIGLSYRDRVRNFCQLLHSIHSAFVSCFILPLHIWRLHFLRQLRNEWRHIVFPRKTMIFLHGMKSPSKTTFRSPNTFLNE